MIGVEPGWSRAGNSLASSAFLFSFPVGIFQDISRKQEEKNSDAHVCVDGRFNRASMGACLGKHQAVNDDKSGSGKRYIVVGSGAAGSPLAAKLARAGCTVTLLELGPDDDWHGDAAPGVPLDLFNPEFSWKLQNLYAPAAVQGLRVADTSVCPRISNAPPSPMAHVVGILGASIILRGEKAELLKADT